MNLSMVKADNKIETVVLPGMSPSNRQWAEEIKRRAKLPQPVKVVYWGHWSGGGSFKYQVELRKVTELIDRKKKVNVVAKSVGTGILISLLPLVRGKVQKIILCGIPSVSEKNLIKARGAFEGFDPQRILCLQNLHDPLASFNEVSVFMQKVNLRIKVIVKKAFDHNYPYFEDFKNFLS